MAYCGGSMRRMATRVMKEVVAKGSAASRGKLLPTPNGRTEFLGQTRNASNEAAGSGTGLGKGAGSGGQLNEAQQFANKTVAAEMISSEGLKSGKALELPGGNKLHFRLSNSPSRLVTSSEQPWFQTVRFAAGVAMTTFAILYVFDKVGSAAAKIWAPALGEKHSLAKEKLREKVIKPWRKTVRDEGELQEDKARIVSTSPRAHMPTSPRAHVPTSPRAQVPTSLKIDAQEEKLGRGVESPTMKTEQREVGGTTASNEPAWKTVAKEIGKETLKEVLHQRTGGTAKGPDPPKIGE